MKNNFHTKYKKSIIQNKDLFNNTTFFEFYGCSENLRDGDSTPVYNGPSVAIRPSVCALVALFLYALKRLGSSFFT